MMPLGVAQLWHSFLGNFQFKIVFFGYAKKWGGWGGWWALRKVEACRLWCGSRQNSRYGVLVPVSCRYLVVNCCSFLFPSQKEQILARFGEAVKSVCLWPKRTSSVLGMAQLQHGFGSISFTLAGEKVRSRAGSVPARFIKVSWASTARFGSARCWRASFFSCLHCHC